MAGKFLKRTAILFAFACVTGCGTYSARMSNERHTTPTTYYKGVNADLQLLELQTGASWAGFACYMTIVCPFAVLASVPVDFAIDTLLLPHDYSRADRWESRMYTHEQVRSMSTYGAFKFDFTSSAKFEKNTSSLSYFIRYRRGNKTISLKVSDAPVRHSAVMMYIPMLEGYAPRSLNVKYGDKVEVGVNISCREKVSESAFGAVPTDSGFSATGFSFYDFESDANKGDSKITIFPSVGCEGAVLASEPSFQSSARTH